MSSLLDDNLAQPNPPKPNQEPQPDKKVAVFFLILFCAAIGGQLKYGTSETALVVGSYVWVPLLVVGLSAFFKTPIKSLQYGLLSLPFIYFFYNAIFPGL
jgi:hypothetical protein